jgi:mRNA-degrading endonuclease HigB of HigAB toxin-antitoxin module
VNFVNRSLLERLKRKNRGNTKLIKAIDKLIDDIQASNWNSQMELKETRPDADCVHGDGFFFFNLNVHRTMILIEFDENKRARVIWTGSHQNYNKTFKNNKNTIKKWLKDNGWI